jgi:ketosteroid isomerase-like protein
MQDHPARLAAARSREAVLAKDRAAWLALFADDALIEDPIGVSPIDPTGRGIAGLEAIARFWDEQIAPRSYTLEVHASYAAGLEVANHMTLRFEVGRSLRGEVTGVFTYRVREDGKIVSLRGYWELDALRRALRPAG